MVIQDINDTPPKFKKDSYFEFVSENIPVGSIIGELKAVDMDSPANTDLVYSFAKNTGKGTTIALKTNDDFISCQLFSWKRGEN